MPPRITDLDPNYMSGSFGVSKLRGFHYGDIFGYVTATDISDCMHACYAYEGCMAGNFVESSGLCTFSTTTMRKNAQVWEEDGIISTHFYFHESPKGKVDEATPARGGADIRIKPGLAPGVVKLNPDEMVPNQSEKYADPWLVRVNHDCIGILVPASFNANGRIITATNTILMPYTCSRDIYANKPRSLIFNVASYWDDLEEQAQLTYEAESISNVKLHELFNEATMNNDIAMIKMKEPIELNYYIRAINLPDKQERPSNLTQCSIIGWMPKGTTEQYNGAPKKFDVQMLERCTQNDRGESATMCIKTVSAHHNDEACKLDRGSPLICYSKNQDGKLVATLYGLKSTHPNNCPTSNGLQFSDIAALAPWLKGEKK